MVKSFREALSLSWESHMISSVQSQSSPVCRFSTGIATLFSPYYYQNCYLYFTTNASTPSILESCILILYFVGWYFIFIRQFSKVLSNFIPKSWGNHFGLFHTCLGKSLGYASADSFLLFNTWLSACFPLELLFACFLHNVWCFTFYYIVQLLQLILWTLATLNHSWYWPRQA